MSTTLNFTTFLSAATAANTSALAKLDYRFPTNAQRTVQGAITSGAAIRVTTYLNPQWVEGDATSAAVSTYTANFTLPLSGPYAGLRIEKVGASGTAWAYGIV